MRLVRHENPVARRLGVALAARPRLVIDETLLASAAESFDPEVQERAKEFARRVLPPRAVLPGFLEVCDPSNTIMPGIATPVEGSSRKLLR